MALLSCYAHYLCLPRSIQNCCHCLYKINFLYNSLYLLKRKHSSRAKSSNSGNSPSTYVTEKSLDMSVVPEMVATKDESANYADDFSELEEPTTCCMSGCANCVWIEYAEALSKRFKDGGEKAKEAIMKISDPNMRAFLLTELKTIKRS